MQETPAENLEQSLERTGVSSSCTGLTQQGTEKFGGVRVGNGPTEDEAGIMDHDQLSQHSEEGDEVSAWNHLSQSDSVIQSLSFKMKLYEVDLCFFLSPKNAQNSTNINRSTWHAPW